ncbi:MAG TPA: four helix bundle protein [Kiritimatiellia bacterium]|nr:four helix bundle protein [Kiritimatiellia bacterium]HNS81040.1 four helix bundle protein [Kiritimatiellia bacterium]HPA78497.1 four helix bundle protein [Kiritimatiellia bacterium]HQQ04556.1 four helix bundle protein [Kiritimatiellia bacterium]
MMKYENFEDVPVWQDAMDLSARIFEMTEDRAFQGRGDIANQIQRAGLSISNNIAEGFERGTTAELIQFLYYAKGSAGEVRSICHVMDRLKVFEHLKSQISDLRSEARSISKQIAGWAFSLQESDIKGSRHLTEQSKKTYHKGKNAKNLLDDLKKQHEDRLEQWKRKREGS